MSTGRIVCGALVFAILGWVILSTGTPTAYLDPAMLAAVVLMSQFAVGFSAGLIPMGRAIQAGLSGNPGTDPVLARLHLSILADARDMIWSSGLILFLLGLVAMMVNMDDPSKISPGVAVGLLPLIYAAILAEFIVNPMRRGLENAWLASQPLASSDPKNEERKNSVFSPRVLSFPIVCLTLLSFFAHVLAFR